MPLSTPGFRSIVARARADISQQLPDADPTIAGSILSALVVSVCGRIFALYKHTEQVARQMFPQTAEDQYLERWASYEGLSRSPAASATGQVIFTGTLGAIVPANTALASARGDVYRTASEISLSNQVIAISSLTRTGATVTAVAVGHQLATGVQATISGAVETAYNGSFTVAVLDADTFTYTIDAAPSSPATGSPQVVFIGALGTVTSEETGRARNLDNGARLQLSSPIVGVQANAFVRHDGATGGADTETDDELRLRVLESRSDIQANFAPTSITRRAKTVPGVTRVLVKRATPVAGDTTIYFVRDGDSNIIPSAADVATVREALLELLPATSEEEALIVEAPTPTTVNFAFASITPNTVTMQQAVAATLDAFFQDDVQIEQSITADQYRSAIIQTIDTETGDVLQDFTLTTPTAAIAITEGAIARLGSVTFA